MSKRHGLVHYEGSTWLKFELFGALALVGSRTPEAHRERWRWIEFHFRKSLSLLGRALCSFGDGLRRHEFATTQLDAEDHAAIATLTTIQTDLEILTVAIFEYLNVLRDNAARVAVLAERPDSEDKFLDGFTKSTDALGKWHSALHSILVKSESTEWHCLAFTRGHGLRQRIVHFNDVVSVQTSRGEGQVDMVSAVFVTGRRDGAVRGDQVDFRRIVTGMFDWLDDLDVMVREVVANQPVCNPGALAPARSVLCGIYSETSALFPRCDPDEAARPLGP